MSFARSAAFLFALGARLAAQTGAAEPWAHFVEPDFPFFSSIVDARRSGRDAAADNLTPRGLVLNLGGNAWVCFDTELLRVSAAWTGGPVTPMSMAQASYQVWNGKSKFGESALPRPAGPVWLANGLYPGWQFGFQPTLKDPRTPAPSPGEIGRGPLPEGLGQFEAIRLTRGGAWLEYRIGDTKIREQITGGNGDGHPTLNRHFRLGSSARPLDLILARQAATAVESTAVAASLTVERGADVRLVRAIGAIGVQIAAHGDPVEFSVTLAPGPRSIPATSVAAAPDADLPPPNRWLPALTTRGTLSPHSGAYVVDNIALPLDNPWHRNVRPADVQFLPDGSAAAVTFDGDVWMISGLSGDLAAVRWKRFASGFNEPMGLAVRAGRIFVFDRGGIWRLQDTTGQGEADVYELFSNAFAQTADAREFASGIKLAPDGSFIISKGGEAYTALGKDNGTVMRVAPDGKTASVLGWGFRQALIGVNAATGLVTASDQEGNYVPATPLYLVEGNRYHGYLSPFQPRERYPAPIADPLTWIPHTVAPSAVTQVWLTGARMGPLNDHLLLLSYNFPELFRVLIDRRASRPQAAVVSLTRDFRFPPLSSGVNPVDGQLYVAGFRIFGTASEQISGLARVRYTGAPVLTPSAVAPLDQGILLNFDTAIDPADVGQLSRYVVERWNYRRTYRYGSFHYRLDGSVGQEAMPVTGAYLSADRRRVFLAVPGMRADVMQMHVGWKLKSAGGEPVENHAYFTPYVLSPFVPANEGFGNLAVNLASRAAPAESDDRETEGLRQSQALGCIACHSTDGSVRMGPSWKGLYGSTVTFADGASRLADEAYLRRHLAAHPTEMVRGFTPSMPNYSRVATAPQVAALLRYIESLR